MLDLSFDVMGITSQRMMLRGDSNVVLPVRTYQRDHDSEGKPKSTTDRERRFASIRDTYIT